MTRNQIVKKINKTICNASPGLFSDEYWLGIKRVQDKIEDLSKALSVDIEFNNTRYESEPGQNIPYRKRWIYTVEGFKVPIVVLIMACGAGSVSDPLSKYDVIAYAS
jgi:hypothetical protein